MRNKFTIFIILGLFTTTQSVMSQNVGHTRPLLTVKEIMNGIITPATAIIWGAYQLQSEAEWLEVQSAALAVIGAGNLLTLGGAAEGELALADEANWIKFNNDMIMAARDVIVAIEARNEEVMSEVGNNSLYPPCESCHQQYQAQ